MTPPPPAGIGLNIIYHAIKAGYFKKPRILSPKKYVLCQKKKKEKKYINQAIQAGYIFMLSHEFYLKINIYILCHSKKYFFSRFCQMKSFFLNQAIKAGYKYMLSQEFYLPLFSGYWP